MRRYTVLMVLGIILIGLGCGTLWFEVMGLSFINERPHHSFLDQKVTYSFSIVDQGNYRFLGDNIEFELKTSNELTDTIEIEANYYQEFGSLQYKERSYYESKPVKNIIFYRENLDKWSTFQQLHRLILKDLQARTIHNYNLFFRPKVVVTVPETKKDQVSIVKAVDPVASFFEGRMSTSA